MLVSGGEERRERVTEERWCRHSTLGGGGGVRWWEGCLVGVRVLGGGGGVRQEEMRGEIG